jgi:hypothetical protein
VSVGAWFLAFRSHQSKLLKALTKRHSITHPKRLQSTYICKLRNMHKATLTRSRTSICLRNRNNYRKCVQSAKCVFHFSVHSSANHISMQHVFIVSAVHMYLSCLLYTCAEMCVGLPVKSAICLSDCSQN